MKCILDGDLTILTAVELRGRLVHDLAAGDSLEIDTRQVTDIDVAGMQVLLATCKSAAEAHIQVSFPEELRGPAVTSALRLLGLNDLDWNHVDESHDKANSGR